MALHLKKNFYLIYLQMNLFPFCGGVLFLNYIGFSTVVSSHYRNLKNTKHSDLTTCEKK
jgi:hypothetical protein